MIFSLFYSESGHPTNAEQMAAQDEGKGITLGQE